MERADSPFPHQVVRHRGARRMSLRVSAAGVRLTVPPRVPARQVEAFLVRSAPWVREQTALLDAPPVPLADGDRLAHLDEELRLVVRRDAAGRVERRGADLLAPADRTDARVEAWYRGEALRLARERSLALAERLGVSVTGVSVRDPRSRWGSCSSAGRLSYSWRLVLAPGRVFDYVVAHEVCHLLRPDHSPAFWALLARTAPGHEQARSWLRANGDLLRRGPAWRATADDGGLSPA